MQRIEEAESLFAQGYNCAQAVFATFCEGLDRETALRLACSFGGGMGKQGLTCGAVTGAYLAISLRHGASRLGDQAAREYSDEKIRRFTEQFRERHDGKLNCNDLLGRDRSDPAAVEFMRRQGIFEQICPRCVRDAAEILEAIL